MLTLLSALPSASPTPGRRSDARVKFCISVDEDEHEEIIKHNELMDSSGSTDLPLTAAPNCVGRFGDAAMEDDDNDVSRLFLD